MGYFLLILLNEINKYTFSNNLAFILFTHRIRECLKNHNIFYLHSIASLRESLLKIAKNNYCITQFAIPIISQLNPLTVCNTNYSLLPLNHCNFQLYSLPTFIRPYKNIISLHSETPHSNL